MVTTCCVAGCKNRAGKNKVSFFRLPLHPESRRTAWIERMNQFRNDVEKRRRSRSKSAPFSQSREPSKHDRVCGDHFITGKPNRDPGHSDYLPTLKLAAPKSLISTSNGSKTCRKSKRKGSENITEETKEAKHGNDENSEEIKQEFVDDSETESTEDTLHREADAAEETKRQEAVDALLTMDGLFSRFNKETQTSEDPCESWLVIKAKLKHLEREIEILQRLNSCLRLEKEKHIVQLKRKMTTTAEDVKKRKLGDGTGDKDDDKSNDQAVTNFAFKDFTLKRVLREDHSSKTICLNGQLSIGDHRSEEAVVLLERKAFDSKTIQSTLNKARTQQILHNDIYSTHNAFSAGLEPDMKATVICPATEKHISKYSEHEPFIVHETAELYKTVTEPCMKQSKFSIQWVYNILNKQTESERIVAEEPDPELGFILLPDMKWDGKNHDQLYLVAIAHRHGVKSLRDLRVEHLPLLENILNKGLAAIWNQYSVPADKMRIYLHYRPSYEHLHVHFTNLRLESPPGSDVLRAHLLQDVIENIKLDSEFYAKKTLSYVLRDGDELYKWYKNAGYFDKKESIEIVDKSS